MNRKHSSLMDSFFSSFNSSTYCLFYLLIPFAIHPVPDHLVMSLCIDRKGNKKANHFQRKNKKKQKNRICHDCKSCFVWVMVCICYIIYRVEARPASVFLD